MRAKTTLAVIVIIMAGMMLAAGKKKDKLVVDQAVPQPPAVCSFSRIEVKPAVVDDQGMFIGSGKQVQFTAVAYDDAGREAPANLSWYFRGLPQDMKFSTLAGHEITGSGGSATFIAKGLASGTFKITAEDETCVNKDNLHIFGGAEINIYPAPDQAAICGPILLMYGQEREITNEQLLGFTNFNIKAEIYGPKNLKGYKVRFYAGKEGKKMHRVRPDEELIRNQLMKAGYGREAYYWAFSPVWLSYGNFAASYELVKDNKPVCASTVTYWTAR